MSAREQHAFEGMFNLIFRIASNQSKAKDTLPYDSTPGSQGGIGDIFLKYHSRSNKDTLLLTYRNSAAEVEEMVDIKKEAMMRCSTDHSLLEWAVIEVFGESMRYYAEATEALAKVKANSESKGAKGKSKAAMTLPPLQPPTYSRMVALLIRTFRDTFRNPHLALAIFEHARTLSAASYVFGCTTGSYNELLETKWACFRDLRGVLESLEDMNANGVVCNFETRRIVERLRREVGARNVWDEADSGNGGDIWAVLSRIEALAKIGDVDEAVVEHKWSRAIPEKWKSADFGDDTGDGYVFGEFVERELDEVRQAKSLKSPFPQKQTQNNEPIIPRRNRW